MKPAYQIETERLLLGTLEPSLADGAYKTWFEDSHVRSFLSVPDRPLRRDELVDYIETENRSETGILFGVFLKDGVQHIGNLHVTHIDRALSRASMGILIGDREHWGRGLASEAIDAAARYVGEVLKLKRLYAGCHHDNPGSARAFRNAAFLELSELPRDLADQDNWRQGIEIDQIMMVRLFA
tara:strand:+ start:3835 stop:4383 length:549 start_codon:yes stop_codon:yes gene_type:complete